MFVSADSGSGWGHWGITSPDHGEKADISLCLPTSSHSSLSPIVMDYRDRDASC